MDKFVLLFTFFMLFRFCCVPRKKIIFSFHCEMDKYVLLFNFRFCCFLKEKVSSLYGIVKWAHFCYLSPFFLVVLPGRKFYVCSTLCNMSTFVLLFTLCFCCVLKEKVLPLYDIIKEANFCYFSLSFLLCFEGKSFIFV